MQTKKFLKLPELLKKTDYDAKIAEVESKIPSITGLATTAALPAVENKIPNVSNLVKKTDYDAKISDIKNEHITTAVYNKFTKDIVANKIKSEGLVNKSDIVGFIDNADLDKGVAILATKTELKAEKDKIAKLEAFDSSYFRGKSNFENDGTQNYLVSQPIQRYF